MGHGIYVKRVMQLLLSISVVSFLVSISSWVCFGFQALRFCVATLPVELITHSINRNCIFLVCNGLLVFIARSSGFSPGANVSQPDSCSSIHASDKVIFSKYIEHDEVREEEENDEANHGMLEESITCTPTVVDKEVVMVHNDDSSFKKWLFDKVTMENEVIHENEEIEGIKELSIDEVNRRFDEFIWKIKEEIRLEPSNQQQLARYV